jgi:NACalpha-BTF3-like transcription factor
MATDLKLFDFVDVLFTMPTKYSEIPDHEKAKHFFMVNRFMSIANPVVADKFNHIRIPQAKTLDYWHFQMSRVYKTVPPWMYTKTKKAAEKKEKEDIKWPDSETVKLYLERTGKSSRELRDAVDMFGQDTLKPVFALEKLVKQSKTE